MALRAAREASGKTQTQVAAESNITVVAYQRYEYGKRKPSADISIRIAKVLGIETLEQFYTLWEQQSEPDGNQT